MKLFPLRSIPGPKSTLAALEGSQVSSSEPRVVPCSPASSSPAGAVSPGNQSCNPCLAFSGLPLCLGWRGDVPQQGMYTHAEFTLQLGTENVHPGLKRTFHVRNFVLESSPRSNIWMPRHSVHQRPFPLPFSLCKMGRCPQ